MGDSPSGIVNITARRLRPVPGVPWTMTDETGLGPDQAAVWREWVERGPQGLIDDDGAPEFP